MKVAIIKGRLNEQPLVNSILLLFIPVVQCTRILYLIFYSQSEHLDNVIKSAAVICDLAKKGEKRFVKKKKSSSSIYLFLEMKSF